MTNRPTHALSGTPPPKKNSRCQIVKTAGRETWRLGGSSRGHVSYYRRNLWTDTGTAALDI